MNGRVLLDGRTLVGRSGVRGIGTYVRGLLEGMASDARSPGIDLLLTRGAPAPPEAARLGLGLGPRVFTVGTRLQPLADPLLLSARLLRSDYAAYHATEWGQALVGRLPTAVTVHDMIPFLFEEYRRSRVRHTVSRRLLSRAEAVITPSECTAHDVARLAGVDPGRITVIPHGVSPEMRPVDEATRAEVLRRHGVRDGGYILAVGVFDPRKRLGLLLETVRRVRGHRPARLVIVGDQRALEPSVRATVEAVGLDQAVQLVGHVPDRDLPALYSAAACLVFTSSYEGFGLPLLEAMACGTPVAAFDNSSIPEVVGDATPLAPDGSVAALADIVGDALEAGAERERRVAAGLVRAAEYSWGQAAGATIDVYQRISR